MYLIMIRDGTRSEWKQLSDNVEDSLFPTIAQVNAWLREHRHYRPLSDKVTEYRIVSLEADAPWCSYCGVHPSCGHHIIIPPYRR